MENFCLVCLHIKEDVCLVLEDDDCKVKWIEKLELCASNIVNTYLLELVNCLTVYFFFRYGVYTALFAIPAARNCTLRTFFTICAIPFIWGRINGTFTVKSVGRFLVH